MAWSTISRYTTLICISFLLVSCSTSRFFKDKPPSPQEDVQATAATEPDGLTKDHLTQIQHQIDRKDLAIHALEEKITRLEEKVAVLEKKPPDAVQKVEEKLKKTADQPEDPAPAQLYQKARNLMLADDFAAAGQSFRSFARQYPGHSLADNSLYWLGECHYSLGEYSQAVAVFKELVAAYPTGEKVPDALLKTGYSYLSMDDINRAHHYLKLVMKKFPFSPAADKAQKKLSPSD